MPAPAIYQRFKERFPARWAQGQRWVVTSAEIAAFLAEPELQVLLADQAEDDALRAEIARLTVVEQQEGDPGP